MKKTPEWFEEAVLLRAGGKSVRKVADELKRRGYKVSYMSVWQWTTKKGSEHRLGREAREYKDFRARYMREWRAYYGDKE